MSDIRERFRDRIAKTLCDDLDLGLRYGAWSTLRSTERDEYREEADQILSTKLDGRYVLALLDLKGKTGWKVVHVFGEKGVLATPENKGKGEG